MNHYGMSPYGNTDKTKYNTKDGYVGADAWASGTRPLLCKLFNDYINDY